MARDLEQPINSPNLAASFIIMYINEITREQEPWQRKQTITSVTGCLLNDILESSRSLEEAFSIILQNKDNVRNYLDELKSKD